MNTTFIAMALAILMATGFLLGLGALSLLTGAIHFFFVKPKIVFLKSQYGNEGFAFGVSWDQEAESVRFDKIKIQLYNAFGEPKQLEIIREYAASGEDFAVDLKIGEPLKKMISAKGFDLATVEIEVSSATFAHKISMKGKKFLTNFTSALETVTEFSEKHKITKAKKLYVDAPERSFVSGPLNKAGKSLKIPTNPEFAAQFSGASADEGKAAGSAAANFAVSKVWIEPGCIVCDACAGIFPEVFEVTSTTCIIKPGAPLDNGLKIQESAEACPVEIIKFTKI